MTKPNHDHRVHIHHVGPPPSLLPVHLLLIMVQLLSAIGFVLTSVVLVGGLNKIVLGLYRDIVAMAILIPVSYFADKGNRVKLSWDVVLYLFLLGFTGMYASSYLLLVGIQYTAPELAALTQPLTPVLTTVIAIVFKVEVIHWHRRDGQSKLLGIVASCAGAFVMTFYQGPGILKLWNNVGEGVTGWTTLVTSSLKDMSYTNMGTLEVEGWISSGQIGALCLLGSCVCVSSLINLQAPLLKRFPAPASVLMYAYGFGAICMAITGYFAVPDSSEWAVGFDVNLAGVLWSGAITAALNLGIMLWCLQRVGPVFVASYIPLQAVCTGLLSLIFLGSTIYLGTIFGAVLVIVGLFLVSWSREETLRLASLPHYIDNSPDNHRSPGDALKEPLIQVGQ